MKGLYLFKENEKFLNFDFTFREIAFFLVILSLLNYKSYGKITRRPQGNEKEAHQDLEGKTRGETRQKRKQELRILFAFPEKRNFPGSALNPDPFQCVSVPFIFFH